MTTININMAGSKPNIGGGGGAGFEDALAALSQGEGGGGADPKLKEAIKALLKMAIGGDGGGQSMCNYQSPCGKACCG